MDAELKAKWVAALRSGKYKQGRKKLRTSRGNYCCLGVLCAVTGQKFSRYDTQLPVDFINEIGFPFIEEHKLISMNDGDKERGTRRHNFVEIADYIEANL